MCRLIALGIVLAITLICLLIVLSVKYLPWWGTVLVVVMLIVVLPTVMKFAGKWLFMQIMVGLFGAKGKVLRGATAVVHSVQATAAPARPRAAIEGVAVDGQEILEAPPKADRDDDDSDDVERDDEARDTTPREFYYMETTITPKPATGKFQHWDLDDLMLVPFDMKVNASAKTDDDTCEVREVRLMREGAAAEPDGSKVMGAHRLRLLLAVKPGVKRLKFRYYFESFGDVRLS